MEPSSGAYAHFLDSVRVMANITSETEIKSISVYFATGSGTSVSSYSNFFPNSNHFEINQYCIPDDIYASSGNYYLVVSVSDGNFTEKKSVPVYLEALEKNTKAVYVLGFPGGNSFNIYEIDSLSLILKANVQGDFLGCDVSSRYSQLISCGRTTGGVNYFSTADFQNIYSIQPINPIQAPSFTSYYFNEELHYIGQYDGIIKAYDSNGFMNFYTEQNPYFVSSQLLRLPHYLAAELISVSGQSNNLTIYFYPSGIGKQFLNIDYDIISMFESSNDELILFAEKNGHAMVYSYSLINNNSTLIKDAGLITLYQASQISTIDYLWSAAEGVFHYNYTSNSASSIAPFSCHDINFDEVKNLYYCSSENSIHILDGQTFSETAVINSADSVMLVRVKYNK